MVGITSEDFTQYYGPIPSGYSNKKYFHKSRNTGKDPYIQNLFQTTDGTGGGDLKNLRTILHSQRKSADMTSKTIMSPEKLEGLKEKRREKAKQAIKILRKTLDSAY